MKTIKEMLQAGRALMQDDVEVDDLQADEEQVNDEIDSEEENESEPEADIAEYPEHESPDFTGNDIETPVEKLDDFGVNDEINKKESSDLLSYDEPEIEQETVGTVEEDSNDPEQRQDEPDELPAIESAENDVEFSELPEMEVPDLSDFPDEQVGDTAPLDTQKLPNPERSGLQGVHDLPATSVTQMAQSEIDDDPTLTHKERSEKQFEIQQRINEDLVDQLSRELGPMFDAIRDEQTATVHNYVNEQTLLTAMLRPR